MSKILRRAFCDIINGYSFTEYNGIPLYIRHLSHRDHIDLDDIEADAMKRAKEKNVPTEKEKIDFLIKHGLWNEKDELEITRQKSYIANLNNSKKSQKLPSVIDSILNQIKEAETKISLLEDKKKDLLGLTAEVFASKLVNEQYIVKSIFKDKNFNNRFLTDESFEDLSDDEFNDIIILYNKSLDICSDDNIKKLVIQDFFQSHYFLCNDDLYSFFGRPIVDLSYLQIKLANQAKYYKYIFENNDIKNLPEDVRNDPDKIVLYLDTTKNGKEMLEKTEGAAGIVGATKKDLEMLGIQSSNKKSLNELNDFLKDFKK